MDNRANQPGPNATNGGHKSAYKAEWGGFMEHYWIILIVPLLAWFLILAEAVRNFVIHPEL